MLDGIRLAKRRPLIVGVLTPCIGAGLFFAWRASLVRHVDQQQALMRAITRHGGLFSLDSDFVDPPNYGPPQWLQSLVGEDLFANIVSINLGATDISDEQVLELARLQHLQSLGIWQTHTTDAGLALLARLRELETLDISQTDITDDGLKQLTKLASIQVLVVGGDRLTDQGLDHLKQLSKLNMLCVVGNQFSQPAKQALEQSLPQTMVVFVPLHQVAEGSPRAPGTSPNDPSAKPQHPPIQPPPPRKPPSTNRSFI